MKQLKFNLDNLFRLSTISAVQTFELENNSTELIISTDVKDELAYELHIESPEGKSFVILEKVDGAVKCLLNSGMLKLGVNKLQLRGVGANDYSIESNRVEFTVKSFINASVEPEPSEQTAFEKLVVEVNVLKNDVDSLSDKIDSTESAVAALGAELVLEKVNRANSDSLLDSEIEAEREAREMEDSSIKNSIQNIEEAKQDKLVAGENITIEGNVISAKGGGGGGDVTKAYVDQQDEAIKKMIPSKTSELENDSGFITEVPEIPSKTSELTNDSGFITDEALNGLVKSVNNVTPDEAGNVTIPTGGSVSDVQINGTSIVSDDVANITGLASQEEVTTIKADLTELDTKFNELVGTSKPANLLIPSDFLHGKSLQFTANVSTPNDIVDSVSTTVINLIETEGDDWYETNCPSGSIFLGYTWYNGDYRRSQFISSFEVEGDHYKFKMLPNMTRLRGFVYNNSIADFDSLRITKYGEWDKQGGTVLLPEGCVTLNNLDDELKSYIAPTTLANKKICGIGDSIMIGVGDGAGGFLDILKDYEENVTAVNLGVGSTTIQFNNNVPSNVTGKCILDRIDDIPEDTDIIILEGGLNDYYHQEQYGTTLGTYEEYLHQYPLSARYENGAYVNLPYVGQSGTLLNNNFCNAFEMCLTKVLVRFIGKPFIYVIPHNPVGSADIDLYFDTAKILCKKYGVPCLDMREEGCMPRINILCGKEGTSRFTVDNVHPNKLGYKTHYAPLIYNFLKSIIV